MTLSSVLSIIVFSGTTILILNYVLKNREIIIGLGTHTIIILMVLALLRLLIPIELPTQNNINITKIWPNIYVFLKNPLIKWYEFEWSILTIFILISLIGSIISLGSLLYSYHRIKKEISTYADVNDFEIVEVITEISKEFKKPKKFHLVYGETISSPIVFGLFDLYIVLPRIDLKKEEWYYILSHEMTHFYLGDLWIRFICELLKSFYWWNPLIYLLREQVVKIQEYRADSIVINKLNKYQQLEYLECLINIAKLKQTMNDVSLVAAFTKDTEREVLKRIELIFNNKRSSRSNLKSLFVAMILIINVLLLPNFFIFEPYAMAEKDSEGVYQINESNSYYILQEDGTYNVYVNDQLFGNVSVIFDNNLKIYNIKGEEIK